MQDEAMINSVTLSPAALEHLRHMITRRGYGAGLRISVKTSGCSGYAYVLDYFDDPKDSDVIKLIDEDIQLAIDRDSVSILKGTTIDYIKEGLNSRFIFINPNETGSCGCGESFSVE